MHFLRFHLRIFLENSKKVSFVQKHLKDQHSGLSMSKRPVPSGYNHSLPIGSGLSAHQTLNMNYAMGLLPNSSSVVQQPCVSPIVANTSTPIAVMNPTATALTGI